MAGGPCAEDYDPTALNLLAGTGSPYTSTAVAATMNHPHSNNNNNNNNNSNTNNNQASSSATAAAAQLIAAATVAAQHQHQQQQQQIGGVNNNNSHAINNHPTAIPPYGLFRPAVAPPNPTLIQNTMQQQVANFHQQQQQVRQQQQHHQQQQQQRQQQQRQHAARAALIAADYEPVLRQQQQHRHHHQQPHHPHHHHHHSLQLSSSEIAMESLQQLPSMGNLFSNNNNLINNDFSSLTNAAVASSAAAAAPVLEASNSPPPVWLEDLQISVSGLSLEPMKGSDVMDRLRRKTTDVASRFLPCVDFLVACQQDLRKGLLYATQKRLIRRAYRDTLSPRQFYQKYVAPLPQRFLMNNRHIMEAKHLREAFEEIQKLAAQARAVERQGAEVMKNTFLGGMKDGESWGLRKWLSKHGGALSICTEMEMILSACQKLNKEDESTKKLAGMMRPLAKKALDRLKADVPQSYQEVSTAHPYLPFFHRLEAACRSMSNFDPEDDDVICLDDTDDEDEVQEVIVKKIAPVAARAKPKSKAKQPKAVPKASLKRAPSGCNSAERPVGKRARVEPVARYAGDNLVKDDDGDSDSDIEIIGIKPAAKTTGDDDDDEDDNSSHSDAKHWTCSGCSTENPKGSAMCDGCNMSRDFMNDLMKFPAFEDVMNVKTGLSDDEGDNSISAFDFGGGVVDSKKSVEDFLAGQGNLLDSPVPVRKATPPALPSYSDAVKLATDLDSLADVFEIGQHTSIRPRTAPVQPGAFWDGARYGSALRVFSQILRMPESVHFLEPVDINDPMYRPHYCSVVKNPICFTDITSALIPETFSNLDFDSGRDGVLSQDQLANWNMWCGQDFLQAIDLVLLNSLAYGKVCDTGRPPTRTETNRLRKALWNGLTDIIQEEVGDNKEVQKQHAPTKRGETSGFVIYKNSRR